ncbi:MAG: hypothetical protein WCP06_09980 [Verrucomicrobiota bacterium]
MKKLTLSLLAVLVAGTSFAGAPMVTSKEFKQPVVPCFRDQEFALDLFYSYNDAEHKGNRVINETNHRVLRVDPVILTDTSLRFQPQYFHDGSGGGVGMDFFFARYFGIGIEGNWWEGVRTGETVHITRGVITDNGIITDNGRRVKFSNNHKEAAQQATGNLILRYPFEGPICWAPYIFGGGGGIWDGSGVGFGDVGLGVEFRITPNIGVFTDWRWNFVGGNNNDNDNNNSNSHRRGDVNTTRAGVRFVF